MNEKEAWKKISANLKLHGRHAFELPVRFGRPASQVVSNRDEWTDALLAAIKDAGPDLDAPLLRWWITEIIDSAVGECRLSGAIVETPTPELSA